MPARLSKPSHVQSLFALVLLVSSFCVRVDRANAYGCGPSPEVGKPRDVPRERWRYTREGAGSFTIANADGNGVVALMNTPGCATSVIGLASLDPATGKERWWRENEGGENDIGDAIQVGDLIVLETGTGVVAIEAASGTERWRLDLGQYPGAAAATANALIFRADREFIAIDLENGDTLWRTAIQGSPGDWDVPDDGRLIVSFSDATNNGALTLAAYETGGGTEHWRAAVEYPAGILALPNLLAGAEGTVLVHLVPFGDEPSVLVAMDASTGEELWRVDDLGASPFGAHVTVVGTDDPVAVVPTSDADERLEVIALDAMTGVERWRSTSIRGLLIADSSAVVGPITDPDGTSRLGGLDPATGQLLWSLPISGADDPEALIGASSIMADGRVVVALGPSQDAKRTRAVAVAVDPAHGDLVWRASYPEFEALFVEAAGAGAVLLTAVKGSEATLLALDTD
ncbi:MAG TPA: PQQ-binding-like beta-propeller repeat protein [Thermomicrobiales bacterium]|nr:PQQ-binding-like beta-propeller repeat protein [Thermomicrobiales bacterium]